MSHPTARRPTRQRPPLEDILTIAVAFIATGVSAQGMWRFSGDVLGLDGPLRLLLFAFIELAVVTSAVRARRSMRENFSAGIDGIAVWALACLTAVLSALDARSPAEAIFRLAAPLVAAWLWERGMALERRRRTGLTRIHWRLTPERILVRLGLAEAADRTVSEVDATRRLTRVALAADKAADTRPGSRAHRRAVRALKREGRHMVTHTAVSTDPTQQQMLMAQLGVARSITRLSNAAPPPFWGAPADVPVTPEVSVIMPVECQPTGRRSVSDEAAESPQQAMIIDTSADTPSDDPDDPGRPDEQDNREAERWIRGRMRAGRTPTQAEIKDRYGFSNGWASLRVKAARADMSAKGYRFLPGNIVQPPTEPGSVNGSRSDHVDDIDMTAVGGEA